MNLCTRTTLACQTTQAIRYQEENFGATIFMILALQMVNEMFVVLERTL